MNPNSNSKAGSFIIFYSWQSDIEDRCCKTFLRKGLTHAAAEAGARLPGNPILTVDEATRGEPGSPSIPDTIARKISSCDVFVADLTSINSHSYIEGVQYRPVQNPNVLFETGLAAAALGWSRVILIGNSAFGNFPEDLPFDLRGHNAMSYRLSMEDIGDDNKVKSVFGGLKKELVAKLETILSADPARLLVPLVDRAGKERQRDIRTLERVLFYLNPDVVDAHVRSAPRSIDWRTIWFFEGFHGCWDRIAMNLYDSEVRDLLQNVHDAWDESLVRFTEYYETTPGSRRSVWATPGDVFRTSKEGEDWKEAEQLLIHLHKLCKDLWELVHNKYIEIDLDDLQDRSLKEYLRDEQEG